MIPPARPHRSKGAFENHPFRRLLQFRYECRAHFHAAHVTFGNSSLAIQSANQDVAGASSVGVFTLAGAALASAADLASIAPVSTMASSTCAARSRAASRLRIGLYSEGALI